MIHDVLVVDRLVVTVFDVDYKIDNNTVAILMLLVENWGKYKLMTLNKLRTKQIFVFPFHLQLFLEK